MRVYQSINEFATTTPVALTIGTFDGVHLGHREILKQLVEIARNAQMPSVVLTFFPHPRMVLGSLDIQQLNTIEERVNMIRECGIDHLIVHPFTQEFSQLSAQTYIEDILIKKIRSQIVVVGYDHRFGKNRQAGIEALQAFQSKYPLEIIEISAQLRDRVAVSSTKIRHALQEGNVSLANRYLGYSYRLKGRIVSGRGIGKTLGFPTANLKIEENYKLVPAVGIYVVQVLINQIRYFGITSIGSNPSVGGTEQTIETYFLDYSGDLYGKTLQLEFLEKIRDEQYFDSVDKLKEAIQNDEQFARKYLKQHV